MKTWQIVATTLLTVLAGVGAQAETYDGVHQITNGRAVADVASEARQSASVGNEYGEAASAGVTPALAVSMDSSVARNEAVAHAHRPNQNIDGKPFFNSVIPSQSTSGTLKFHMNSQTGD